jgi:Cysteine-rich CPCC
MKIPDRFLRARGEPFGEYACPACGFLTLREPPPGSYEICAICGWEDDAVQFEDPNYRGGANQPSLNEWRSQFEAETLPELVRSGFNLPPRA